MNQKYLFQSKNRQVIYRYSNFFNSDSNLIQNLITSRAKWHNCHKIQVSVMPIGHAGFYLILTYDRLEAWIMGYENNLYLFCTVIKDASKAWVCNKLKILQEVHCNLSLKHLSFDQC